MVEPGIIPFHIIASNLIFDSFLKLSSTCLQKSCLSMGYFHRMLAASLSWNQKHGIILFLMLLQNQERVVSDTKSWQERLYLEHRIFRGAIFLYFIG